MRKFLASFALVAAVASQAASDTTWQFKPYSNEVTDIKVWGSGTDAITWIGTRHGVVRIKGTDTLWLHPTNSKLPGAVISPENASSDSLRLTVTSLDSNGNYWVGYRNRKSNALYRIDEAGTIYDPSSKLGTTPGAIVGITSGKSATYVGYSNGLIVSFATLSTGPNPVAVAAPGSSFPMTALACGRGDTLWLGFSGDKNGNLKYLAPVADAVPAYWKSGSLQGDSILTHNIYGIWFGGGDYNGGKFIRTTTIGPNGTFGPDSLTAFTQYENPVHVLKAGGDNSNQFGVIQIPNDLPQFFKGDSLFRISTTRGTLSRSSITPTIVPGLNSGALLNTTSGELLLGSSNSLGLYHFVGDALTATAHGPRLRGRVISSAPGGRDSVWVATDSAVYVSTSSTGLVRKYDPVTGTIRSISRDSSGVVWIGQSNGLYTLPATVSAIKDTILLMAHTSSTHWFLKRNASGRITLLKQSAGVLDSLALTGIGTDSTLIRKIIANASGVWLFTRKASASWTGNIYCNSGMGWGKWLGQTGAAGYFDFDVTSNNVWNVSKEDSRQGTYNASVAGFGASTAVANLVDRMSFLTNTGNEVQVHAESDTSAWYFESEGTDFFTRTHFYRVSTALGGRVTASYSADTTGQLQSGTIVPGESIHPDGNAGYWLVMDNGVSRMKVTTTVGLTASSAAPSFASLQAGAVQVSLTQVSAVRYEILDLSGRVLEMKNLGILSEGTHAIALPKATGMRILRIKAGEHTETLRLPAL